MRSTLLLATLLLSTQNAPLAGQERLAGQQFGAYYDWFHERSQVADHYTDQARLHVFSQEAPLYAGPCAESAILDHLPIGAAVTNIVEDEFFIPEGELNGYLDLWYQVAFRDDKGRRVEGYLWGGDVAKSWLAVDLTGDGRSEFVMLGIASTPRKRATDINAEIRVLHNQRLWYQKLVPGLCVFEACAVSGLLRVIEDEQLTGARFIEAGTITVGCWAGVEKALFYWDGSRLEQVYYAELTTPKEYQKKSFIVQRPGETSAQLCRYSHADPQYNPVWDCKTLKIGPADEHTMVLNEKAR